MLLRADGEHPFPLFGPRIVFDARLDVEEHGGPHIGAVGGPFRQAFVVGIAGAGEGGPGCAHAVGERLCFGVPGGMCETCAQLYIDPELIEMLDLGEGRCVFAIESDQVLQERAWSGADQG